MSKKEELRLLLKDIPFIQKMLLAALVDAEEKKVDKEEFFLSTSFREILASNLFYILTSRLDIDEDSTEKDTNNISFISKYIWVTIKLTPIPLLISVVLANIEFNHNIELSDFHEEFGRGCILGQKLKRGITFNIVPERTPS